VTDITTARASLATALKMIEAQRYDRAVQFLTEDVGPVLESLDGGGLVKAREAELPEGYYEAECIETLGVSDLTKGKKYMIKPLSNASGVMVTVYCDDKRNENFFYRGARFHRIEGGGE